MLLETCGTWSQTASCEWALQHAQASWAWSAAIWTSGQFGTIHWTHGTPQLQQQVPPPLQWWCHPSKHFEHHCPLRKLTWWKSRGWPEMMTHTGGTLSFYMCYLWYIKTPLATNCSTVARKSSFRATVRHRSTKKNSLVTSLRNSLELEWSQVEHEMRGVGRSPW